MAADVSEMSSIKEEKEPIIQEMKVEIDSAIQRIKQFDLGGLKGTTSLLPVCEQFLSTSEQDTVATWHQRLRNPSWRQLISNIVNELSKLFYSSPALFLPKIHEKLTPIVTLLYYFNLIKETDIQRILFYFEVTRMVSAQCKETYQSFKKKYAEPFKELFRSSLSEMRENLELLERHLMVDFLRGDVTALEKAYYFSAFIQDIHSKVGDLSKKSMLKLEPGKLFLENGLKKYLYATVYQRNGNMPRLSPLLDSAEEKVNSVLSQINSHLNAYRQEVSSVKSQSSYPETYFKFIEDDQYCANPNLLLIALLEDYAKVGENSSASWLLLYPMVHPKRHHRAAAVTLCQFLKDESSWSDKIKTQLLNSELPGGSFKSRLAFFFALTAPLQQKLGEFITPTQSPSQQS